MIPLVVFGEDQRGVAQKDHAGRKFEHGVGISFGPDTDQEGSARGVGTSGVGILGVVMLGLKKAAYVRQSVRHVVGQSVFHAGVLVEGAGLGVSEIKSKSFGLSLGCGWGDAVRNLHGAFTFV